MSVTGRNRRDLSVLLHQFVFRGPLVGGLHAGAQGRIALDPRGFDVPGALELLAREGRSLVVVRGKLADPVQAVGVVRQAVVQGLERGAHEVGGGFAVLGQELGVGFHHVVGALDVQVRGEEFLERQVHGLERLRLVRGVADDRIDLAAGHDGGVVVGHLDQFDLGDIHARRVEHGGGDRGEVDEVAELLALEVLEAGDLFIGEDRERGDAAVGGDGRQVLAVRRREHHVRGGAQRGELGLARGDELLAVGTGGIDLNVEAQCVKVAEFLRQENIQLAGAGRIAVSGNVGDLSCILVALAGRVVEDCLGVGWLRRSGCATAAGAQ